MQERIAHIISGIFNPIIIPTYLLAILFFNEVYFSLTLPVEFRMRILLYIFFMTFALPLFTYLVFRRLKMISSLDMPTREERTFPFLITGILYYLTFHLLRDLEISYHFFNLLLGATAIMVITMLVNFLWKISIHMTGIGGAVGALLGLSFERIVDLPGFLIASILVAGLVGYSRIRVNAHTPAQVYAGFITGCVIMTWIMMW